MPFETKEYYDQYTAQNAKELEPLRKSYLANRDYVNWFEGRASGTSKYLGENDFARLLFDKNETFSAAAGKFTVRAWPPVLRGKPKEQYSLADRQGVSPEVINTVEAVRQRSANPNAESTLDLFKFGKAPLFLFWISDETSRKPPKSWRISVIACSRRGRWRRRGRLWPCRPPSKSPSHCKTPRKASPASWLNSRTSWPRSWAATAWSCAASPRWKPRRPVKACRRFTPRTPCRRIRSSSLAPIRCSKSSASPNSVAPIKIGFDKLDAINKELFDKYKAGEKNQTSQRLVQILTNSPQTAFFVAVVGPESANPAEKSLTPMQRQLKRFAEAYKDPADTFVQEGFESHAASAYKVLRDALRERLSWEVTEENAKLFDGSGN